IDDFSEFVRGHAATYDPASCMSCALFQYCRSEVRCSSDPTVLLTEIGVRRELRRAAEPVLDGSDPAAAIPASVVAGLRATVNGLPEWTARRRVDPVGLPGTINIVLAKSDAAALGVHGIGVQRIELDGTPTPWAFTVFDEPQSPKTR